MRTTLTSDIPSWEGEFTFDQVRFVKPNSRDLVLELTDGEGNSVGDHVPDRGRQEAALLAPPDEPLTGRAPRPGGAFLPRPGVSACQRGRLRRRGPRRRAL